MPIHELTIDELQLVLCVSLGHEVKLIPELLHDEGLDVGHSLLVGRLLEGLHTDKIV